MPSCLGVLVGPLASIGANAATVTFTTLTHTRVTTVSPALTEALRDLTVALILNLAALGIVSAVTHRRPAYA